MAWQRPAVAVVAGVAAVVGLSGCPGPPRPPNVALALDGTAVEVVAYLCPYDQIIRLSAFDVDSGETWAVTPPLGPLSSRPSPIVVSHRLFVVPTGWELQNATLRAFSVGRRYEVATGMYRDPVVEFTVEDLNRLGDRLLVGTDGGTETMTRPEFEKNAADSCPK